MHVLIRDQVLNQQKFFVIQHVISLLDSLSQVVVDTDTVTRFKGGLDKFKQDRSFSGY